MTFTLRYITNKITYGLINSFSVGFCFGCFPNKIYVRFEDLKYNLIPTPIITGLIGSFAFTISPFLIINYFSNSVYFDKLIDKYDIIIKRYHQFDGQNNKYAFPSQIIIDVKNKHNIIK